MVITKIRPNPGYTYRLTTPIASIDEFVRATVDEFRIHFFDLPMNVLQGHFIGLAGRRFSLHENRDALTSFYRSARCPV